MIFGADTKGQSIMEKISVLIAFTCNPYLAVLQKETYLKYWKDEVDEVLVNVNGNNYEMMKFIAELWRKDDKVKWVFEAPFEMRQGVAFDVLYHLVSGGIVMTIDSDCFIYKKGVVTKFADKIRSGNFDAVGSDGHHVKPHQVATKIYKLYGMVRYNPFLAFFRNSILRRIDDFTFRTRPFKAGDYYKATGKLEYDGDFDVMSFLSIQFNAKSDKHFLIPDTSCGEYVHLSAMSSIFRRNFRKLEFAKPDDTYQPRGGSIGYWVWFYMVYNATKNGVPFREYNAEYERMFDEELKKIGRTMAEIKNGAAAFSIQHPGLF